MRTVRLSLVATVILMLLGGLGVVADQPEDAPVTATHVTGKVTGWRPGVWGPYTETPGYAYQLDTSWEVDIEWSDPRLPGVMRSNVNQTWHKGEGDDVGIIASAYTHRLEGPDGSWVATEYSLLEQTDPEAGRSFLMFTGEGGYEGMSAMLFGTTVTNAEGAEEDTFEGYIFTDEMPPMPDPVEPTAE